MAATEVIGLVIEYTRNSMSRRIASPASRSRKPIASWQATLPRRATSTTAPGMAPCSTSRASVSVSRLRRWGEKPSSSGLAAEGMLNVIAVSLFPELLAGDGGALGHGLELGVDHVGVDGRLPDPGAEAAIGTGDHVLAPDELGIARDALRDQLGMLDEVGFGLDYAADQHLA